MKPIPNPLSKRRAALLFPNGPLRLAAWLGLAVGISAPGCGARGAAGPKSPPASRPSPVLFTDVAAEMGLTYRYAHPGASPFNILQVTSGGGAAFLDYDGDGWLDILCVGWPRPALFRSEQGKRFVDVTAAAGLKCPEAIWSGCATGDFDNDGAPDVFLTGYERTALFRNRGDGTFADVTEQAGCRVSRWTSSAAFADVDRDGFLDLFVGRYLRFERGMPEFETVRGVKLSLPPEAYAADRGVLLMNRSGRSFRDATAEAGLAAAQGKVLGVAFGDPDQRGWDDLYLANDGRMQDYYRNQGKGRFRSFSGRNGTGFESDGGPQGGMGVDFGDYDGDGRLDLFVANFADEPKSLYRNLGDGLFEHAAHRAGLAQSTRPWVAFGAKLFDADNDGVLDLAVVNGHIRDLIRQVDPGNSYRQAAQFFRGVGGGRFEDLSESVGPDYRRPIVGRGLAVGDFDNDGDPDLLAADLEGPPLLLRNDLQIPASWLTLHLVGRRSNRMAIGARVELLAGEQRQVREVRTDGSYHSAHDPRVHFGLGAAQRVREIRIRWPSGKRQVLRDVAPNQVLRVAEPG